MDNLSYLVDTLSDISSGNKGVGHSIYPLDAIENMSFISDARHSFP
jgi:hypothetical protein